MKDLIRSPIPRTPESPPSPPSPPGRPTPLRGAILFAALLSALVALLKACGDPAPPTDGALDGNIIIGQGMDAGDASMGQDAPASEEDAGPTMDAGDDARDSGADAQVVDGPLDAASPLDAGELDAESQFDASEGSQDSGLDPCLEEPKHILTATEARARTELLGQVVEVHGVAEIGEIRCASPTSQPSAPCSRDCVAPILIDGVLALSASPCRATSPGCRGTECGLVCSPPVLGIAQRFLGRPQSDPDAGVSLSLVRVE